MWRRSFWFAGGVVTMLLVAEVVFRLLPVSTSTQTDYHLGNKLLTYPPHHQWRISTGWDLRDAQTLRSNEQGFVSEHNFTHNPNAIALIGDSYSESSMLNTKDRPAVQLESLLGGKPVYAMGSPGTALLDYAERVRWARQTFGIQDVVILMEPGDIQQTLCGSGNIHSECLDAKTLAPRSEPRPAPSAIKRWARRSALAQYINSQLKFSPQRMWATAVSQSRPAQGHDVGKPAVKPVAKKLETDFSVVNAVSKEFFKRIDNAEPGRLMIVIDTASNQRANKSRPDDPERLRFMALAREAGVTVVDAGPIYDQHFQTSHLSLDVGPYDKHLNRKGIALLMTAAAQALSRKE
ncbi:MAG: hypothetical protein HEQ39_03670 [Rhizobacter sp.]